MATASTTKFIKNVAGALTEQAATTTSAGAADAQLLPALNASGVLDLTITNGKTTSVGAADSGKLAALDATGRLDTTMMPVGVAADTASIMTSEALAAGDFVNIWNSTGPKVRKADATTSGKKAMGFVLAAFSSGIAATVYFEGSNNQVTGQVPGDVFLQIVAGTAGATAPNASGNLVQNIGFATSATSINFQSQVPVTLA